MTNYKTLFETKENYLAFRAHWKKAMNDEKLKHQMTSAHHALYTLLRDKDLNKAFTPITNKVKLANGAAANYGLDNALQNIDIECKRIGSTNEWHQKWLNDFLAPFNDTVTKDMLKAVHLYKHSYHC